MIFPTVVIGGVSVLTLLVSDPAYAANPLRQDLWRAGHAHAGVLLLSLIALRYVDEAHLSERNRLLVRLAFPTTAVLPPLTFFLSVLTPNATAPNELINLACIGATVLVAAMLTLGVGLTRAHAAAPVPGPQPTTKE